MQITVISKTKVNPSKNQKEGWSYTFDISEKLNHLETLWAQIKGRGHYFLYDEVTQTLHNYAVDLNLEVGDVLEAVRTHEIPTAQIEISDNTLKSILKQLNFSSIQNMTFNAWMTSDGKSVTLNLKPS